MEEREHEENVQLKQYKQSMRDIRYIFKTYGKQHPDEAWETIRRLAYDPKLRLRTSEGRLAAEDEKK